MEVIGGVVGEWNPVDLIVCDVVAVWVIPSFDCGSYWGDVVDSPFWVGVGWVCRLVGVYCECWLVGVVVGLDDEGVDVGDGFLVGWVVIMGECCWSFVPCEDVGEVCAWGEEWSGSVGFGW